MEYASMGSLHQVRFRQVGENSAVCSQVDPLLLFVEDQCHHFTPEASAGIVIAERCWIQRLAFMYKILNDQVAVPPDSVDLVLSSS